MKQLVAARRVAAGILCCAAIIVCVTPGQAATCFLRGTSGLAPVAETQEAPAYPPISKRLNEEGVTVLRVGIGPDGSVVNDMVVRSSGSDRLDSAAAAIVKQNWRWQPLTSGCSPIAAGTTVRFTWILTNATAQVQTVEEEQPRSSLAEAPNVAALYQQKLLLARSLVSQLRRADPPLTTLEAAWAPIDGKFRASVAGFPEMQRQSAIIAFHNALQEALSPRLALFDAKLIDNSAHMDIDTLKALITYNETPPGQKQLTNPPVLTSEDTEAIHKLVSAHPGAVVFPLSVGLLYSPTPQIRTEQGESFVRDFQKILCPKLTALNINHTMCSDTNAIPTAFVSAAICGLGYCRGTLLGKQTEAMPQGAGQQATMVATAGNSSYPYSQQPSQATNSSCSAAEDSAREAAEEGSFRYSSSGCSTPSPNTPISSGIPYSESKLADDTEMAEIFSSFCIKSFPDADAASQFLNTRGAVPMQQSEVDGYLKSDPGQGWYLKTATAIYGLTIENPPFHTCAVRRMTPDGMASIQHLLTNMKSYVAQVGGKIVQTMPQLTHIPNGPDVTQMGFGVQNGDGKLTDAFGIFLSNYHGRVGQPWVANAGSGVGVEVRASRLIR